MNIIGVNSPNPLPRPVRQDFHILPVGKSWGVKHEGSDVYAGYFLTKTEAQAFGMNLAREGAVSLVLHGRDGRIQSVRSYS